MVGSRGNSSFGVIRKNGLQLPVVVRLLPLREGGLRYPLLVGRIAMCLCSCSDGNGTSIGI